MKIDMKYFENVDRYDDVMNGSRALSIDIMSLDLGWPWTVLARSQKFHFYYLKYGEFAYNVGWVYLLAICSRHSYRFGLRILSIVQIHAPQNVFLVLKDLQYVCHSAGLHTFQTSSPFIDTAMRQRAPLIHYWLFAPVWCRSRLNSFQLCHRGPIEYHYLIFASHYLAQPAAFVPKIITFGQSIWKIQAKMWVGPIFMSRAV